MGPKVPFPHTFLGATLVVVVGGFVLAWATQAFLDKPASSGGVNPAPVNIPSGLPAGQSSTSLDTRDAPRRELPVRSTPPAPNASRPSHTNEPTPQSGTAAGTVQGDLAAGELESLTLNHAEAVSLRTFKGSASVTFGEVAGVTFATLLIAPAAGPVIRAPVYAAGRSYMVQTGDSEAFAATVTAMDYSRRTLTIQLYRK